MLRDYLNNNEDFVIDRNNFNKRVYFFNLYLYLFWLGICLLVNCFIYSFVHPVIFPIEGKEFQASFLLCVLFDVPVMVFVSGLVSDFVDVTGIFLKSKKRKGAKLNTKALMQAISCFPNLQVVTVLEKYYTLTSEGWDIAEIQFYYDDYEIVSGFWAYWFMYSVIKHQAFCWKVDSIVKKHIKNIESKKRFKEQRKAQSEEVYSKMLKELNELKNDVN